MINQKKEQEFIIERPISNNQFYTVANGRKIISKKAREWKAKTILSIKEQREIEKLWFDRISLEIIFHPCNEREFDLDNFVKPIQDCLKESGVYRDDSQIDLLVVRRGEKLKRKVNVCRLKIMSLWD